MAFLIYRKEFDKLIAAGEKYMLAGHRLIYTIWQSKNKPVNQGWHISVDELIKAHTNGKESDKTMSFLIDYNPNSKREIGIVELLDIYLYTYASKSGEVWWSPVMLRLRRILHETSSTDFPPDEIERVKKTMNIPKEDREIVEFLYINGDKDHWNWGMNGMTNAAFIESPAREYFRKFF